MFLILYEVHLRERFFYDGWKKVLEVESRNGDDEYGIYWEGEAKVLYKLYGMG